MNWTQFLGGLAAIYAIYYLLNVLFDLLLGGRPDKADNFPPELVFADEEGPIDAGALTTGNDAAGQNPVTAPAKVLSSGPLHSTGGVNMRDLFALAQSDLIRFTGAIPY